MIADSLNSKDAGTTDLAIVDDSKSSGSSESPSLPRSFSDEDISKIQRRIGIGQLSTVYTVGILISSRSTDNALAVHHVLGHANRRQ